MTVIAGGKFRPADSGQTECAQAAGLYVLVYAEEVRWIVLVLHLRQARIVGAKRRPDCVGVLFAQEIQKVGTASQRPICSHRLRRNAPIDRASLLERGAVGHAGHIGLGRGSITERADFRDAQDICHQQIRGGEAIGGQPFSLVQTFSSWSRRFPIQSARPLSFAPDISRNHQGTVTISIELSAAIIH